MVLHPPEHVVLQSPEHVVLHPDLHPPVHEEEQSSLQEAVQVVLHSPEHVLLHPDLHPPVQVVEHSPLHELPQPSVQAVLHEPVQLVVHSPLHVVEQLLIQALEQSVQPKSSSFSQEVKTTGPNATKPIIGRMLLAVFLKNWRRLWSSLLFIFLSIV